MPAANKTKFRRKIAFLLLVLAGAGWSCGGSEPPRPGEKSGKLVPERTARVSYVIDGDTFILEGGERIRFLGINAPEIRKLSGGSYHGTDEPWGRDAANFLGRLVEGKEVGLIFDEPRTGKYGRTLAYVVYNGELVNGLLLREGYARYADYGNPLVFGEELRALESEAKARRRGLWENQPGSFRPPVYLTGGKNCGFYFDPEDPALIQLPEEERFRVTGPEAQAMGLASFAEAAADDSR